MPKPRCAKCGRDGSACLFDSIVFRGHTHDYEPAAPSPGPLNKESDHA